MSTPRLAQLVSDGRSALVAVVFEGTVLVGDLDRKAAVDRVVLEKVSEGGWVSDVAYGNDVEVTTIVEQSEDVATDPAEPHQAKSSCCHRCPFCSSETSCHTPSF